MNPGTGKKLGGGWWCLNANLVFCLGSKPFTLKLKFWNWTEQQSLRNIRQLLKIPFFFWNPYIFKFHSPKV
jgi:hypothetical protein